MKNKWFYRILTIILLILIAVEISLRQFFGFCNAPLYITDKDFELAEKIDQLLLV
jgi:hypothetical protein